MLALQTLAAAYVLQPARLGLFHNDVAAARAGVCVSSTATEKRTAATLGHVLYSQSGSELVVVEPVLRGEADVGELVRFEGGGTGVLLMERCGLYFAARLQGSSESREPVALLGEQLGIKWRPGERWGGVCDYLGQPLGEPLGEPAGDLPVFCEPVPQQQRKPITESVHCGVLGLDALTPLGRGQSMALFAPDELPEGAGRSELARRVLAAQSALPSGLRSIYVLTGDEGTQQAATSELREAGALDNTLVLCAASEAQGVLAMHAACSIASADGGDVLIVVDSLAPYLWLWKASCAALQAKGVDVRQEEEGSQQRTMYAKLTERAARRKEGGSVTLLLLQPSPSVKAAGAARKASYELADFEAAGFSQRACARVAMLADKGIVITEEVLTKLGIPTPGSGHPQGDGPRRDHQHLEELTSLVDGHVQLQESLAAAGRCPPLDPANSLTRIGVGSARTLRSAASTPAMQQLTRALRLELAAASDPAGSDARELRRAAAYFAVLQQPQPRPLPLSEELILLLAASEGQLDAPASEMPPSELPPLLSGLTAHVQAAAPELLSKLDSTGVLLDPMVETLRELVTAYFQGGATPSAEADASGVTSWYDAGVRLAA